MSGHDLSDEALERELTELKERLYLPEERDLAEPVVSLIETGENPRNRFSWHGRVRALRPTRLIPLAGAAAVLVVLGLVLAIWPGARDAVASWLGLRDVEIVVTPSPSSPMSELEGLDLGERLTLAESSARADFTLLLPPRLGSPNEVYFSEARPSGVVSFVWAPTPDLPALEVDSTVAVLVSEFRANFDDPPLVSKVTTPEGVKPVTVAGSRGYWVEAGHTVIFRLLDREGERFTDTPRIAANVLLWERDELTIRMESQLSETEAILLAESFR